MTNKKKEKKETNNEIKWRGLIKNEVIPKIVLKRIFIIIRNNEEMLLKDASDEGWLITFWRYLSLTPKLMKKQILTNI